MKIGFITIRTSSLQESISFYESVLDFTLERRFSPAEGIEIAFLTDRETGRIELIEGGPGEPAKGSNISIGIEVVNMDETERQLKKNCVKIINGPNKLPNGTRLMQAEGPDGVILGFVQEGS